MRILTVLLAALLMISGPVAAKNLPLGAVQLFRAFDGTQGWGCTAWAYKYPNGVPVRLTNFHCVGDPESGTPSDAAFSIGGQPAVLVAGNHERDLAMLVLVTEPAKQQYLRLADKQAGFADDLIRIGYPMGYLAVSKGVVSNPALVWGFSKFPVMLADYAGGPGSSGSPVLDSSGRVTGMHAFTWGTYGGGPTLADLKLFLHGN